MRIKNQFYGIFIISILSFSLISFNIYKKLDIRSSFYLHNTSPNLSIILMIGDGMGYEHIKLAGLVENGKNNSFCMEALQYKSNVTTFSEDNLVTDSAAAATAMATGSKTNNGMLSVLPNLVILETILEIAQNLGRATGIVTTTSITHATPAAFMTHVPSRSSTSEIVTQIVEKASVDIILGGGKSYFNSTQISDLELNGYAYIENNTALMESNSTKIIGLFAGDHLPYEISRDPLLTPSLYNMTKKAIEQLSKNPNGFFLMIEGGKIDHAAHANNKVDVALETIEFNSAIDYAINYSIQSDNTLLIITADHETGGLKILDNTLNDTLPSVFDSYEQKKMLRIERANNISVSWSTTSHTAADVPIFIFNPISSQLENNCLIDNTKIFDIMHSFFYYNNKNTNSSNNPISGYQIGIIGIIVFSVIIIVKKKSIKGIKSSN